MTIILLNAEFPRSNLAINKINDGVTATAGLNKVPLSKVSITPPGIGRLPMNPEMAAKKKTRRQARGHLAVEIQTVSDIPGTAVQRTTLSALTRLARINTGISFINKNNTHKENISDLSNIESIKIPIGGSWVDTVVFSDTAGVGTVAARHL